jgi:RND family efflux transporter MFP subunit
MKRIPKSLAVLGVPALLAGCNTEHRTEAASPRPVLSVVVAPQTTAPLAFAGTVEPRFKADQGFEVLGRIVSREASTGDAVKKGQRLATLDPLAYGLVVRSAEADLAAANARLENAAGTEARQRKLLQQNVASDAQYDAARQGRETAEAGVTRAKADVEKAKERLGYTELRAEFDGVITATEAETGQVVQPGQTVVSLARQDIREAVIDIPERIARGLTLGSRLDVVLQADPSVQASGSIREINPQADAVTRTLRVRITLIEPPDGFRLGATITARVPADASPELALPRTAVLTRDGKTMVWIVDPNTKTVSTRDVVVTDRDPSTIKVVSGLTPGVRIVTAGVNSLSPGQIVKLENGELQ